MKIETRAQAAEDAARKVEVGTHVAVPLGLLETLIDAANLAYEPAWGGSIGVPHNAARAASNILARHRGLR